MNYKQILSLFILKNKLNTSKKLMNKNDLVNELKMKEIKLSDKVIDDIDSTLNNRYQLKFNDNAMTYTYQHELLKNFKPLDSLIDLESLASLDYVLKNAKVKKNLKTVGINYAFSDFIVLSDGTRYDRFKAVKKCLYKKRVFRYELKGRYKISYVNHTDELVKDLVSKYDLIFVNDEKRIKGYSKFIEKLDQACDKYNKLLVKVPCWYLHEVTCSNCGAIIEKTNYFTFTCPNCKLKIDSYLNMAINVHQVGLRLYKLGKRKRLIA